MLPEILIQEVNALQEGGHELKLIDAEGFANILFYKYPLPNLYNKVNTQLLLRFPISYPNGKPDMFWTDENLSLSDGRIPKQADQIECYLSQRWRRFSWHLSTWNPGSDNLKMYLEFVNIGLLKATKL